MAVWDGETIKLIDTDDCNIEEDPEHCQWFRSWEAWRLVSRTPANGMPSVCGVHFIVIIEHAFCVEYTEQTATRLHCQYWYVFV
jgi:hypothetical protein